MAQCPIGAPLKAGQSRIAWASCHRLFRVHWTAVDVEWWNGWWPNLVDSWVGLVHWIFSRFWILYGSLGGREGSHWIGSTFEIQNAWFSARFVEYGSSFDWFSWILWFSEKLGRLPDTVFIVFSGRVLHNSHFPGFRSGPKRTATKKYADSWWYHLGECLLWLFQARLRFWFLCHFCRPLPFAYLNSGSLVFTKFGHQPDAYSKTDRQTGRRIE